MTAQLLIGVIALTTSFTVSVIPILVARARRRRERALLIADLNPRRPGVFFHSGGQWHSPVEVGVETVDIPADRKAKTVEKWLDR